MWTMEENIDKLKQHGETFESAGIFKTTNRTVRESKAFSLKGLTSASTATIQHYDTKKQLNRNGKEIKSLYFEALNVVSSGMTHEMISRNDALSFEIVEGTYNFFKINARGFLSPCKLIFK